MYEYRVTKYDPTNRDASGAYTVDDWTSFGDVGRTFNGQVLSGECYDRVERAYIDAALHFMREAGAETLSVHGLECSFGEHLGLSNGLSLPAPQLGSVFRGVLRENVWTRFESKNAFVHFGYDYYMYVGVPIDCRDSIAFAENRGLFVEPFASPYKERAS